MHPKFKLTCSLFTALFMLSITGCANKGFTSSNQQLIEINSSDMAYYWVTKDTLISWQQILPQSTVEQAQDKANYKVSFVINNSGEMQLVSMVNTSDGIKIHEDELTGLSEYQFYPTTRNIGRQAVMINTIITL
ncbi:hypothetical protein L2719_13770 [Shewanella schlegeliana]|uniref:TonB C-terminal domain-containing protein n=1 Tax=Shewanella schlegeliana TaxID=190308 RepID=A0ABS1T561_9GAMM|nr:hypothetical protein [Shewanella schlegeliana]MBL4914972.1 hypothetical protein [Shewanella schlegeliana]MCL1110616.1 hypothetical protein [Shewanella schlegeliana]GIU37926.1 hypothetical protein TUM4433_38880 [Shewanella schlegeliana]